MDTVIKYILSFEEGSEPLRSFLNVFQLASGRPLLEEVFPWNVGLESDSLEDKLTISDVAARNSLGNIHQVEIQLMNYLSLRERNNIHLGEAIRTSA